MTVRVGDYTRVHATLLPEPCGYPEFLGALEEHWEKFGYRAKAVELHVPYGDYRVEKEWMINRLMYTSTGREQIINTDFGTVNLIHSDFPDIRLYFYL